MKDERIKGYSYRLELNKRQLHLYVRYFPHEEKKVGVTLLANLKSVFNGRKTLPKMTMKRNRCVCPSSLAFEKEMNVAIQRVIDFTKQVEEHLESYLDITPNLELTPTLWKDAYDEVLEGKTGYEVLMKFCEFGKVHANLIKSRGSIKTAKNYLESIDKFEMFLGGDVSFSRLNAKKFIDFQTHLLEDLHLRTSTMETHLSNLQAIYYAAGKRFNVDKILIDLTNNPFKFFDKKYKMNSRQKEQWRGRKKDYLDKDELKQLEEATLESQKRRNAIDLDFYRQVHLLHCEMGLRIGDFCTMRVQNIFIDKKNNRYIYQDPMRKTGYDVAIRLTEKAIKIIQPFLENKEKEDFVLPLLTKEYEDEGELVAEIDNVTAKYNNAMKIIMEQAKIDKNISSHSARRTVANKGSRQKAKSQLGHKSEAMIDTYRDLMTDIDIYENV